MENGGSQQVDPKVSEMESKLKEMEYEKNNIEYTLSRRQDEYMQLNETLLKTKEELEQQTKDYESVVIQISSTGLRITVYSQYASYNVYQSLRTTFGS